jgi:hypothetical protein
MLYFRIADPGFSPNLCSLILFAEYSDILPCYTLNAVLEIIRFIRVVYVLYRFRKMWKGMKLGGNYCSRYIIRGEFVVTFIATKFQIFIIFLYIYADLKVL